MPDIEALIAEARNPGRALSAQEWALLAQQLAEALEAATVAPAIDREALRGALANVLSDVTNYPEAVRSRMLGQYTGSLIESAAVAVEQSFRDVRDVQAEALERVRDEIRSLACWADPVTGRSGFNLGNDEDGEAGARMAVLDILAQAIREARSER